MEQTENTQDKNIDRFELERFTAAQEDVYPAALAELEAGRKRTHWMWFVFPQIDGLGYSSMTKRFSIKTLDEAAAYLQHEILGARLEECVEAVLNAPENRTAYEIFGSPDDAKLKSSMTLFDAVSEEKNVFAAVLEKYFAGEKDQRTLEILANMKN